MLQHIPRLQDDFMFTQVAMSNDGLLEIVSQLLWTCPATVGTLKFWVV